MIATSNRPHRFRGRLTGLINPIVLRIARFIPFYGVLEHRGRRSGRLHRTPLAAVRTEHGFLLPLAFGERSNWVLNVKHAGKARVEWLGRPFDISDPEIIDWAEGKGELSAAERWVAPIFGVKGFLRVKAAPAARRP